MKTIEQVDLGNSETIFMKKDWLGYRVVHPNRDSNGKLILVNFLVGGWGNFFKLLFILFVLACFLYGFKQVTASCKDMTENPDKYFECEVPISNDNLQLNFMVGENNEET